MSEQHGLPQELPPAYVPPAYIAPASALDQPALGLVLVFAALMALPESATMLAQILVLDSSPEWSFVALTGLMCGSALLELVAGLAIAWQWRARTRHVLFLAYLACGLVLVVCVFAVWRHDLGSKQAAVIALETLGGLLVVGGISTLLYQPVHVYTYGRTLLEGHASAGSWLGAALSPLVAVVIGGLQVWTGVRMARGLPARRWLIAYVIAALVGYAGFELVSLVWWLFDSDELHVKYVFANLVIMVVLSTVRPLVVWQFAKREAESGARVDAALPWIALWFVPQLAARCLLGDEMDRAMGSMSLSLVLLCGAAGIACLVAARASLRGENAERAWMFGTAIAAVIFGLVVYWVFTQHDDGRALHAAMLSLVAQAVPPVTLLFATMATGAWLARRVTSAR